jgi:hypothetical protein
MQKKSDLLSLEALPMVEEKSNVANEEEDSEEAELKKEALKAALEAVS